MVTFHFQILDIIPHSASEFLLYAYFGCWTVPVDRENDIIIYVEHGGVRFEKFCICEALIRRLGAPTLTICGFQYLLMDRSIWICRLLFLHIVMLVCIRSDTVDLGLLTACTAELNHIPDCTDNYFSDNRHSIICIVEPSWKVHHMNMHEKNCSWNHGNILLSTTTILLPWK